MDKRNGSGDGILDWTVIILAALLFFRTADVLSYFSPPILAEIFGFDVSYIYGVVCALAVEGVALALHFNRRAQHFTPAVIVKWSLLAISGACQVFDGFVITDTLSQQSDTMKAVFQYGVPLLPLIIVFMIIGIGHLPEDEQTQFKGIKHMLPDFHKLWNGDEEALANNGSKKPNFTNGKVKQ